MTPREISSAAWFYYSYVATLDAGMLTLGMPTDKVGAFSFLAWLLINRGPNLPK